MEEMKDRMADAADRMMDEFDRWTARIVPVILLIVVGIGAGYGWRMIQEERKEVVRPAVFQSEMEREAWHARLRRHGLDGDVAVIGRDENGFYFIRDGRRCAF